MTRPDPWDFKDLTSTRRLWLSSRLARHVQHTFNNRLNVAFGYTSLLQRDAGEDVIQHLNRTLERASTLISSFTYLTREQSVVASRLEVDELLEEVAGLSSVMPGIAVETEPTGFALTSVEKHTVFHLLMQLCFQLGDEDDQQTVNVRASADQLDGEDALRITVSGSDTGEPSSEFETFVSELCTSLGGQIEKSKGAWSILLPGLEQSEEAFLTVLVVGAADQIRQQCVASLGEVGIEAVDVGDSDVAIDIFEKNPEVFDYVVMATEEPSREERTFMLRIKTFRPDVETVVLGESSTATADYQSSADEVGRFLVALARK